VSKKPKNRPVRFWSRSDVFRHPVAVVTGVTVGETIDAWGMEEARVLRLTVSPAGAPLSCPLFQGKPIRGNIDNLVITTIYGEL